MELALAPHKTMVVIVVESGAAILFAALGNLAEVSYQIETVGN